MYNNKQRSRRANVKRKHKRRKERAYADRRALIEYQRIQRRPSAGSGQSPKETHP